MVFWGFFFLSYKLIMLATLNLLVILSFSSMFIHSVFMTYEMLNVPVPHVLQCPMYAFL